MESVSVRLLKAEKALYKKSIARVRVEGELTECFKMEQGVRQGVKQGRPLSRGYSMPFGHGGPGSKGGLQCGD